MNGNDNSDQSKHSLSGKTILIVNSNSANDPLHSKKIFVRKVKNLGMKIILLGSEAATFQPYADYCINVNTSNYAESLTVLESFLQDNPTVKLDGVATFLEDDVLLVSKIVDKYKLIGIPYKVANQVRNKFSFRDFCKHNNLPVIKFRELKSGRDIDEVTKNFSFPLVVKQAYTNRSV